MSMESVARTPLYRRLFRFRLRTLLVLTALLAVALTFAGREVREWRRRERARAQRAQMLGLGDYPGDIPIRPVPIERGLR